MAALFAIFSLGVPGWVTQQVGVRAFYAREDTWRPMLLGSGFAVAVLPLYWGLAGSLGARGIALASTLAISANAAAVLLWARGRHGGPPLAPLLSTGWRLLLVSAVAAAAAHAVQTDAPGKLAAVQNLALGGALYGIVAAAGLWLAGDVASQTAVLDLWRAVARRVRGGPNPRVDSRDE